MSEISKHLYNAEIMREVGGDLAEALKDAIKEHPEKALLIGGGLGLFYMLRNKKLKLKYKRGDTEFEFGAE